MKVEKGIPIPTRGTFAKSELRETLEAMEVGDSVFHEQGGVPPRILQMRSRATWRLLDPKRFVSRTEGSGIRIWRFS